MDNRPPYSLNIGGRLLELDEPQVMGILNVTPDSFYAGSRRQTEQEIAERARQIAGQGGSIIDIGAYSTRPGAASVDEGEELARLRLALPIVQREAPGVLLSVDTFRASVAQRLYDEFGDFIVNDVSGGADPDMFALVTRLGLPYVLTHSPLGTLSAPTGQSAAAPAADSPAAFMPSLLLYLGKRVAALRELGQKDIILDPGFGFGKSLDENYLLMGQLEVLHTLGLPLLVGISRKSMIYRLFGTTPDEALNGTAVLDTLALQAGAHILRVHDVREAVETVRIVQKTAQASATSRNVNLSNR